MTVTTGEIALGVFLGLLARPIFGVALNMGLHYLWPCSTYPEPKVREFLNKVVILI